MWSNIHYTNINWFFFKNEVIANEVEHGVEYHVSSTTCSIAKGLERDIFLEWLIKPINNSYNPIPEKIEIHKVGRLGAHGIGIQFTQFITNDAKIIKGKY